MAERKVRNRGVPFLWSSYNEFKGRADVNIFGRQVKGNSKGPTLTGLVDGVNGDSRGLNVTGVVKSNDGDSYGPKITGLFNRVGRRANGAMITGLFNYSWGAKNFLLQCGGLGNIVEKITFPKETFVLQFGLGNKIGDQYCPFFNVYGIKNLPSMIKKEFSKDLKLIIKKKR